MTNIEIADGQPLTYDWFAAVVQKIKDIETQLPKNIANRQIVKFTGNGLAGKNITVDSDSFEITNGTNKKNIIKQKIPFTNSFSAIPTVVASLADQEGNGEKLADPPYAILTVQNVTKNNFVIKIRFINTTTSNSPVQVNYIAIGQSGTGN